jgi:hypothetical protein
MTLADFFTAVNGAGIRLANVDGQLQLRGPASAVTPEIRAAAAEHKPALLAMLPVTPAPDAAGAAPGPSEAAVGDVASGGAVVPAAAAGVVKGAERMMDSGDLRGDHDWRDWRLEWLLEVGLLYLRMRHCREADALALLRPLAEATPASPAEWLDLGRRIRDAESELSRRGRLPAYPWPSRGEQ